MLTLMRVADVLNLPSIQYYYGSSESELQSAEDVIEYIELEDYHEGIRDQMRKDGINAVPIHVASVWAIAKDYDEPSFALVPSALGMGNGHHRLRIAVELNHEWVLTTDDIDATGGDDDPVTSFEEEMCFTQSDLYVWRYGQLVSPLFGKGLRDVDIGWAKIKRQQANEADATAAVASGIGEYGISNACYRLAGILRRQADEIIKANVEKSNPHV